MAVIKSLPATKSLSNQLNYLVKEGKTVEELKEGINCTTDNVEQEFNIIKQMYAKTDGKQYYHFTQAFSPEDNITPQKAHELGKEWINNNIKDHQVYMVTHIDKNHIHNHFVINSVNIDNGLKLQISPSKLFEMKKDSNRLCERENLLEINLERNKGISKTDNEYRLEKKGITTWKDELRQCIDFGKSQTKSIAELKEYLKEHFNIEVRETKNSISYKHPEGNRAVRGNKLGGSYTKEGLLNEYNVRQIKSNEIRAERGTDRTKGDIGKSILFGGNEVSSGRDDKLISIDKTEQRQTEPNNRPVEERKTDTRARSDREHTKIKQSSPSITFGNGGNEERQQSKDRGINQDNTENTRNNTGYIHEVSRDTVRDKQLREGEDMEGQSNPILNTTGSNNRIDIDDSRSLLSDNPLDELVKKFDKTLQKAEEKEKEKKALADLEAKAREERKLKLEQKPKVKYKSRDFGPEL
ncbi:relaxase/mobilization nuclease domain-containing protein [Clostridium sp. ZBS13]|uniref:relaxase/mobilization nuclease domain-containing protein n=3 Tax=unclassified Clostridium TaxID=2614128 RepID=UPI00207927D5|nr:relaxase/mobilization nuclease domain-containing protein [Clostridium sp. ZBS13]